MREGRKEQIFNIERVTLPMSYRKPEVAGAYIRGKWSAFDIPILPIDQKNDDICVKYAKLFCNQIRKEMHERESLTRARTACRFLKTRMQNKS